MKHATSCHQKTSFDYLLWSSLSLVIIGYALHWQLHAHLPYPWLATLSHAIFEITNTIWWGAAAGIIMVGILSQIPREFILSILGRGGTLTGILRATAAAGPRHQLLTSSSI